MYHPRRWRGWFDFGTGALGDMAIHNMDPAFYALDLGAPVATEAQPVPLKNETYPAWKIITYEFAAKGNRPAVKMIWYDGGKQPPRPDDLDPDANWPTTASTSSATRAPCSAAAGPAAAAVARELREGFPRPAKTIPRSIGHRAEWIQACKDHKPADAKAGFDYSGPFTEALLVGNLAVRLQKRIEWDAAAMKATNAPEADALIRKPYRPGFGDDAPLVVGWVEHGPPASWCVTRTGPEQRYVFPTVRLRAQPTISPPVCSTHPTDFR